jgi:RNA polymerase sigma-70 factor (ECF subfamily)
MDPIVTDARIQELAAHVDGVRELARRLVRDGALAEDVAQETCAIAWRRGRFDARWLAGVVRNVARHAFRAQARRERHEREAARPDVAESAEAAVERAEFGRHVVGLLLALDEPYRSTLVLSFFEGLSPTEIAARTGDPPGTVRSRLKRGLDLLRASLDADRAGDRRKWALMLAPLGWPRRVTGAAATAAGVAVMGTAMKLSAAAVVASIAIWATWPSGARAPASGALMSKEIAAAAPGAPTRAAASRSGREAPVAAAEVAAPPPAPHARVRGRVVDATTGETLVGARVFVVRKSKERGFVWRLETGADGSFSGDVAETTTYSEHIPWSAVTTPLSVEASAPGHLRRQGAWTATGTDGAEEIGDIRLERGVVVRGRVTTTSGGPVPRAAVFASDSPYLPGYGFPLQSARRFAETDDAGRFEFGEGLRPSDDANTYTFLAVCPRGCAYVSAPVRRSPEMVADVVLVLRVAGAAVRVLGPDGLPAEGAEVIAQPRFGAFRGHLQPNRTLLSVSNDPVLAAVFTRRTDADGRATFDGLPVDDAAVYDFSAATNGCVPGWREGVEVRESPVANVEIVLTKDQALVAGGRVLDALGRPIEGARILDSSFGHTVTVTDAAGVFTLTRIRGAPGADAKQIDVSKDGFATLRRVRVLFVVDDGTPLPEIRMTAPATIEGVVLDQDGRPLAGAFVVLRRGEQRINLPGVGGTDAEGRFAFPDATPGEWMLTVVPRDAADGCVQPPDKLVVGGTHDVVVRVERLPPGRARVVVDVVDAMSGKAVDVDDACVYDDHAVRGQNVALPKPQIDRGRVTVTPLRPGDYSLWLRIADHPHQVVQIHVAEDATDVGATCRVRQGSTITGRVRMPPEFAGKPVKVVYMPRDTRTVPGGGSWRPITSQGRVEVAADGTFRIEGVTPTQIRLEVRERGWLGDAVVDASAGDAVVTIDVRRGAVVTFRSGESLERLVSWIEGSLDGGPWFHISQDVTEKGARLESANTLAPGLLRWRAVFRASFYSNDVADAAAPQQGEVTLVAGKDVEIVVPLVRPR